MLLVSSSARDVVTANNTARTASKPNHPSNHIIVYFAMSEGPVKNVTVRKKMVTFETRRFLRKVFRRQVAPFCTLIT
jgi:hypothetical protein